MACVIMKSFEVAVSYRRDCRCNQVNRFNIVVNIKVVGEFDQSIAGLILDTMDQNPTAGEVVERQNEFDTC